MLKKEKKLMYGDMSPTFYSMSLYFILSNE